MCNIMIIYSKPNENKKPRFGFSYNWALIGSIFHKAGHNVILHDYSCEEYTDDSFFSQLIDENIQLVIVEFDSFALKRSENNNHGKYLIQNIKNKYPGIITIAYGYYCCITNTDIPYADITIKQNNINLIIFSIQQIFNKISLVQYKNYNMLPFINRSLLNSIEYFNKNKISTLIQTASGCENTCVFCQRKGWQSKYVPHSVSYVIAEFEEIASLQYKNIWIIDENFTFNLKRAKTILRKLIESKISKNMKIAISSWANIDQEFLDLSLEGNIKTISFGIETGNIEILKFYRKNINLEKAKQLIQYADSIGLFTVGNFIIGAPMETIETINETFSFINSCSFDQVNIKTLDYMIGSELYTKIDINQIKNTTHVFACKENGLNIFNLEEIKSIKNKFLGQYYTNIAEKTLKKIKVYGTPFD